MHSTKYIAWLVKLSVDPVIRRRTRGLGVEVSTARMYFNRSWFLGVQSVKLQGGGAATCTALVEENFQEKRRAPP